jgi:FkbM family methyltransferase
MEKEYLLRKLNKVEQFATTSKTGRLLTNPFRYLSSLFFREFIYSRKKQERIREVTLFWDQKMQIALPASTDIYLAGGKTHDSEIRLTRFLIENLDPGDSFLDIGAHYGFFTLLASVLTGPGGSILSFEPAAKSYELLLANTRHADNIRIHRKAVSDTTEPITFYQFPNLFSEYNSIDIAQFENEDWFADFRPEKTTVEATTIDVIAAGGNFVPKIIKIDVEGGEYNVLKGGADLLSRHKPIIAMEHLEAGRHNEKHQEAVNLLRGLHYKSYIITASGSLEEISDINTYLTGNKMESDNIIFKNN